jgi:predicted DsbA family dithiol-disulfide isomerase
VNDTLTKLDSLTPEETKALYAPNDGPITDHSEKVRFTINYLPFRLYPDAPTEGQDKREWYRKSRYGDTDEKWKSYMMIMTNHGNEAGIDFDFGGIIANTLPAHRVLQYFQTSKGAVVADKLVVSLYRQYFEQPKDPSAEETLLTACKDAGIDEKEAEKVVSDEYEGLQAVKEAIQEQKGNGVDAVPFVVVEGSRKDVTITGAQSVKDYVKALREIIKLA